MRHVLLVSVVVAIAVLTAPYFTDRTNEENGGVDEA